MVKQVIIKNLRTGNNITLKRDDGRYIIDSIDWGAVQANPVTYRLPYQVGESFSGVVPGTRSINIIGYIIPRYNNIDSHISWNNYYAQLEETVEDSKVILNRLINIYDDVLITVGNYTIKARPNESIKYSIDTVQNNDVLCLFSVDLTAYDPMFHSVEKSTEDMTNFSSGFHFPLVIPVNKGIKFGVTGNMARASVVNVGDVPTGFKAIFLFLESYQGGLTMYNQTTGEYLGFGNLEISENDKLLIETGIGSEDAILYHNGEVVSVTGKITPGSVFLQVDRGINNYMYAVDTQIKIIANLEYINKYFGFKEM